MTPPEKRLPWKMKRRASAGWLPLAAFVALAVPGTVGCPPPPPKPPPVEERIQSPQDLLMAMREAGARLKSFRASGSVDMRRGHKRVKAHMLAVVQRPAWLRFETESFFDQPLSIMVTDGMEFSLWDMDQGRFVVGPATPANISQVIPIPMDGPAVVGLLLGDPPLIPYARARLEWDQDANGYLLELANTRELQRIRVHPWRLRPAEITCYRGRGLLYRLSYHAWHEKSDHPPVPSKIRFEMPSEKIRLILKIRKVEWNPQLDKKLFVLTPPEGIPVERAEP